jgi:plastocyanin
MCSATAATAVLAAAPAALADQTVYAGFPSMFLTPDVTIAQGEALNFTNFDITGHDVTAKDKANGKPIFASNLTGAGGTEPVAGAQALVAGKYEFICSLHVNMVGTLTVSSTGQPPPSGGGGGGPTATDSKAPAAQVKVLDKKLSAVRKRGALRVSVTSDEDASVSLTATSGKTRFALGSARLKAGTTNVTMKLTKAGARLAKKSTKLALSVAVKAGDAAGNASSSSSKSKLR